MTQPSENKPAASEHHERIARHAGGFGVATLCSRILGYTRDAIMAHVFGNSMAADAFFAAYRIPNLWRRLLGEGALTASFVPTYTEYLKTKSPEETEEFLSATFTFFLMVLIGVVTLGVIFSPVLTRLITAGFGRIPGKLELTTELTRIMFPYLLFVCVAAFFAGILNSHRIFFVPALSPSILSLVDIVYMIALIRFAPNAIVGLACVVVAGGFMQGAIQWPSLSKIGIRFRFLWKPNHSGLKRVRRLMLPAMMGISVDQLNAFVDTICASFLTQGSVSALYYSNRLMQLPLALFGIAAASVTLPAMSASLAEKNIQEMKETLNFGMRMVSFLLIPATVGLAVAGEPIVRLLFERGAFTRTGTLMTYQALLFYSLGLVAYGSTRLLAAALYSLQDTKTPVRAAAVAMVVNACLNVTLMGPMGVGGLALATSFASFVNGWLHWRALRERLGLLGGKRLLNTVLKSLFASFVMGAVCWALLRLPMVQAHTSLVLLVILAGSGVYFLMAQVLGMDERRIVLSLFKR